MRVRVLGAALAVAVLLPAPARAGTYDVVSCGAPGAGGVNAAWTPVTEAYSGPADPGAYELLDSCGSGGGLQARSKAAPGVSARFLTSASWRLTAPEGARLTHIDVWRFNQVSRYNDGSGTDAWDASASADTAALPLENCNPPDAGYCATGNATPMSAASLGSYDLGARSVTWGVTCAPPTVASCTTAVQDGPLAGLPFGWMQLWGSRVTVSDDGAPAVTTGGPGTDPGTRGPADAISVSGADPVGIRTLRLLANGTEVARQDQACDYRQVAPCPTRASASLQLTGVPSGTVAVTASAIDTAGNETTVPLTVELDATAPALGRLRVRGRSVSLAVRDATGLAPGAVLAYRPSRTAAFVALPTTVAGGRVLRARLPRGRAAGKGLRVTVADPLGNRTDGQLTRLTLRAGGRALRGGRLRTRFGRTARVTGRLTTLDGVPVAGTLARAERVHRAGQPFAAAAGVPLGAGGRFVLTRPAGVSRVVRLALPEGAGVAARTDEVLLGTAASSTIRADRRRLRPGQVVRLGGRLRLAGATVPPSGKLVDLQGFSGGRWRTFDTARARGRAARWRASYRFRGPGTFPLRVRIRRESTFPFELGYSPAVRVRVAR